jgi:hypothetical protein
VIYVVDALGPGGKMIDFGSFKRAESLLASSRAGEEKEQRQGASH